MFIMDGEGVVQIHRKFTVAISLPPIGRRPGGSIFGRRGPWGATCIKDSTIKQHPTEMTEGLTRPGPGGPGELLLLLLFYRHYYHYYYLLLLSSLLFLFVLLMLSVVIFFPCLQ